MDGLYGEVRSFSMPKRRQTSRIIRPSTSIPWSLQSEIGVPKRMKSCSTITLAIVTASMLRIGMASAHFVYESKHVRIHTWPRSDFGCGTVKSIYHISYERSLFRQLTSVIRITFGTLPNETSSIAFPRKPVELSSDLV